MKIIFIGLVLLFSIFSIFAQTALVENKTKNIFNKAGKIKQIRADIVAGDLLVLTETEYDFGKILQGKPVTHIFEVINEGKDSLKIENVQASCGCNTPDWERNKIQGPKQKTNITVGYNAAGEGVFAKTITISYNGSQTKQIIIKGEVLKSPSTSVPENKELINLQNQ